MQRGAFCVGLLHTHVAARVHANVHALCRGAVALAPSACPLSANVRSARTDALSRSYAGQALERTLQTVQRDSARLQRINVALQHRVRFARVRMRAVFAVFAASIDALTW